MTADSEPSNRFDRVRQAVEAGEPSGPADLQHLTEWTFAVICALTPALEGIQRAATGLLTNPGLVRAARRYAEWNESSEPPQPRPR